MGGSFRRACKVGLCFVLAAALALVPLDFKIVSVGDAKHSNKLGLEVQESEAHAIAPVVAGGAAVAAGLGISEEALIAALVGTFAIATGISASQWDTGAFAGMFDASGNIVSDIGSNTAKFNDTAYDTMLPPGVKTWDELTDSEKAKFGTKANYARGAWLGLSVETELAVIQDGSLVPSPEPEDPEEKKKWQKGRNIITMLVAGAAVGVGEVANWFASSLGESVKDFLFGPDSTFNLKLQYEELINNVRVRWAVGEFQYYYASGPIQGTSSDSWVYFSDVRTGTDGVWFDTNYNSAGQTQVITSWNASYNTSGKFFEFPTNGTTVSYSYYNSDLSFQSSGTQSLRGSGQQTLRWPPRSSTPRQAFNANWRGTYSFGTYGSMSNGVWTGDELQKENVDYDYLPEVPPQLPGTVISSPTTYNNWFNNYQIEPDGSERTAILPGYISDPASQNGTIYDPEYDDFIRETPENEVVPVPDTEPFVPDTPENPDIPVQPDDWDFPKALDDAMKNLGEGAFGNLFPFCLVVDIQRLSDKLATSAGYGQTRGGLLKAQGNTRAEFYEVVLPLSDFGLPGVDDLTLDCEPVFRLGLLMRSWWTILLMASLIAESVRYFLK